MVNCDQDAKFSEEEFLILMQGILGSSGEKDKKVSKSKASKHSPLPESIYPYLGKRESKEIDAENLKDSFIKFIFEQISSTKDYTANNNHFNEFFGIYERLARDNNCLLGLESGLVTRFKSFLQGITVSNKRAYLVKFDVRLSQNRTRTRTLRRYSDWRTLAS